MEKGSKASTSDMKSLSGGERSFSTLAFILALGGEISAAFHCLDEFDVFLDVQNRLVGPGWLMMHGNVVCIQCVLRVSFILAPGGGRCLSPSTAWTRSTSSWTSRTAW